MSLLLFDTTFLVDTERRDVDLDDAMGDDDDVAIAAITVAELLAGVKLTSGKRRAARHAYVEGIIESLSIIAYDTPVARAHAELPATVRRAGRPRAAHDLIIAATARATGRTVITADVAAFADLPDVVTHHHR